MSEETANLGPVQRRVLDELRGTGISLVSFDELFADRGLWQELQADMEAFIGPRRSGSRPARAEARRSSSSAATSAASRSCRSSRRAALGRPLAPVCRRRRAARHRQRLPRRHDQARRLRPVVHAAGRRGRRPGRTRSSGTATPRTSTSSRSSSTSRTSTRRRGRSSTSPEAPRAAATATSGRGGRGRRATRRRKSSSGDPARPTGSRGDRARRHDGHLRHERLPPRRVRAQQAADPLHAYLREQEDHGRSARAAQVHRSTGVTASSPSRRASR